MTTKHERRLARALQLLGVQRARYMLVDPATGKDIREARDTEVDHVRRSANFSGVATLEGRAITLRKIEDRR